VASKIKLDILDAQARCPLKAYFLLNGELGVKSDFEKLALETREGRIGGSRATSTKTHATSHAP
jgi:hypothetical protein